MNTYEYEPSGLPRMTTKELQSELLQELCPKVIFNLNPDEMDSKEYKPVALYQSGEGGRLTTIEVQARRINEKKSDVI